MDRKKTLFERSAALTIAVVMLFSMIPTQVFAQGDAENKPATMVSTAESENLPAAQSGSVASAQSTSVPTTQSNSVPAAQDNSAPAAQSGSVASVQSTSVPTAQSNSVPAAQDSNAPAAQGNSVASAQSTSVPAAQSTSTPVIPNGNGSEVLNTPATGITLEPNTLNLNIGDEAQLAATVVPEDTTDVITWTSDQPSIAAVEADASDNKQAKVTGIAAGSATITATCGSQTATCTVLVKGPATAVSIQQDVITEGGTIYAVDHMEGIQLTAVTEPSAEFCTDTVVWSVEGTSVASIDANTGMLTFGELSADSESIKVKATAGSASTELNFTLSKKDDQVTVQSSSFTYGDAIELKASAISGSDVTFQLDEQAENTASATVSSDGMVTVSKTGTFTVTATSAGNQYYKPNTINQEITVQPKSITVSYTAPSAKIVKISDGTTDLDTVGTTVNAEILKNAFALADGQVVGSDDVKLAVDVSGVQFATTAVGPNSIDLTAVKFSLEGTAAGNYVLDSVTGSGTCEARIDPVVPSQGSETVNAGDGAKTVGNTGSSVTFLPGTAGSNQGDSNFWYGANGVPVQLDPGVSLLAVQEDGTAGAECVETQQGESYFTAASGVSFYLCSNNTYYGPYTITYVQDTTGPIIELEKVEATKGNGASEEVGDDGIIFGKEATYTVRVSDEQSGVDTNSVYYAIADSQPAIDAAGVWTHVSVTPDAQNGYTFTVSAPASGNLYVKAADRVANVSAQDFRALVLEENAPVLTVTLDGTAVADQDETPAYKNDYMLQITAEEPSASGQIARQSGIQKITCSITQEDGTLLVPEYALVENELPQQLDQIANYLSSSVTSSFTELAKTKDLNGKYLLTLTATDFCGNQSTFRYTLAMDTTAPVIQVAMEGGQFYQENGSTVYYYKADNCGVTVHFADEHLDEAQCKVTVAGSTASKEMTVASGEMSVTFSAEDIAALGDGTITITATAGDTAGNNQSKLAQESTGVAVSDSQATFVLDTQAPVLKSVTAEGGAYVESDQAVYFNTEFVLNFKLEETNFAESLVQNQTQRTNDGPESVFEVAEDGNISLTISGTAENAVYTMAIMAQDKAGNLMVAGADLPTTGQQAIQVDTGVATLTNRFVLDTVAPQVVEVTGTKGNNYDEAVYYTGAFDTTFAIKEANYNELQLTVETSGGDVGEKTIEDGTRQDGCYTKTVKIPSVETAKTNYKILLSGTDKAGNPLTVAPECLESGPHQVSAENGSVTVKDRIMDNVAPEAEISYTNLDQTHYYQEDSESDAATAYYKDTFEVSIGIADEGSLDENKLFYSRTWKGEVDAQGALGTSTAPDVTSKTFTGDAVSSLRVAADTEKHLTDGTYVYRLYGTDKAGNPLTVRENQYTGNDGAPQTKQGCATAETAYVGAPKAMDTLAPTAIIQYTQLEDDHYYQDAGKQVNAYYNRDFTASFTFEDYYGAEGKSYGIDGSKIHYTQNVTDEQDQALSDKTDPMNQAKMTAAYTVTGEADNAHYAFGSYGEDKAGNDLVVTENQTKDNKSSYSYTASAKEQCQLYYHKVLDTAAPTFSLALKDPTNDLSVAVDGQKYAYYNTNIEAEFTVQDANMDPLKMKTATASKIGTDFNYDTANVAWSPIKLEKSAGVTSDTVVVLKQTVSQDGIYRFEIEGEDRAGNRLVQSDKESAKKDFRATLQQGEGQFWTYIKVRDTLAPTLAVEFADHEVFYKAMLGEIAQQNNTYYNLQLNKPYRQSSTATGTLTKADCSPASVAYEISSTTASQKEAGSAYSHENLSLSFNGDQIFTIAKLVVKDRAGNISTMPKASNKIYLDVAAPEADELVPTVSIVAKQSGEGRSVAGRDLFSSTVNVQAAIADPGEGVRSSGLYQVYYQVLVNDADWTDKVSVSGKGSVVSPGVIGYGTSGKDYESSASADEVITSQDVIDFVFDAQTFNYNDVKIYVWAEDNSGNMLTQAEAAHYFFGIDITTPTIDVRYDNNDAQNEKYFKNDRTATITVTERNFDPSKTVITTESTQISSWTYQAGSMDNGDDDQWVATVAYTNDGDYTFDVTTSDLVSHKAESPNYGDSVAAREFTIDKTKPIINISFDNDDVRNGKYYNKARTATVNIEEHNFSTDGVTLEATANIQEGSVAVPSAGGWSEAGDMNTATVPFTQDGNYTMHVEYVDLAGNEAEPQDVNEFVVDTTEPELTFSINGQVFDKASYEPQAYNGEVVPSITYHDINYDVNGTQMSIVGAKNADSQILSGAPAEDAMGGVYTCENIEQLPENDDVYTCTGKVMDMAGNESTVNFVFSVNRYGSNYLLSDATQKLVDNYYTNQVPTLDVTEVNVNTLNFNEITYALNGNIQTLQPEVDYSVAESGTETSWKQYDYKIFDSNFTKEGVYDITISSEDEAGNLNSNHTERVKEYSKNISFVLDQTAPSITISGVEENGLYDTDTRSISINYSENFAMNNITVTNGDKTETYTADQLEATDGMIEFVVPASNNKQSVTVTAADKAGNTISIESAHFLLTSNKFVQFVNNTPLLVGSIAVVLLIAAAVIDYLRKGFLYQLLYKKASKRK